MFKILYLPEAVFVCNSSWVDEHATFKTKNKALKALTRNHVYKVGFVFVGDYNVNLYRKELDWPYEDIPKYLFEVIEC